MATHRTTKGIVAGVLGLALLLGGGTFALWYDSHTVSTGTVNSGELNFSLGTQVWRNGATTIPDITTYMVVPGDVITLTTPLTIHAVGNDLKATLKADTAAITGDPALNAAITSSFAVTGLADGTGTAGAYEVRPADDGLVVSAVLTLTFPSTTNGAAPAADRTNWWHLTAQSETINLSAVTFDLAQHL